MDETNAFSPLNQFIMQQNAVSPTKNMMVDEKLMEMVRLALQTNPSLVNGLLTEQPQPQQQPPQQQQFQHIPQQPLPTQHPVMITAPDTINTFSGAADQMLKASPSASSDMSSQDSGEAEHQMLMMQQQQRQIQMQNGAFQPVTPLQQLNVDSPANIAAGTPNSDGARQFFRHETWLECFTTTRSREYDAFLYSVYVAERTDKKYDGWTYYDCLHRLQSKCRYRVRAKRQDEFFICEEKGVHNHGAVEPVGQAGSHAGLPKTIREIVDKSYNEGWTLESRNAKVDAEIKRLGLPENPRLGRQIDNRVAYLRRVKNLNETRRIQDQVNGVPQGIQDPDTLSQALYNPEVMQALIDRNGGQLTVNQGVVEQLFGSQNIADLVATPTSGASFEAPPPKQEEKQLPKPTPMNATPELLQFLQQNQEQLNQQMAAAAQENTPDENMQ